MKTLSYITIMLTLFVFAIGNQTAVADEAESTGIRLDAYDEVVITDHPDSANVLNGANVTFAVSATGAAPLSYQWRKDGVDLPGQTASTLTLTAVTSVDAGSYTVVVSNIAGPVTSNAAILTVANALMVTIASNPAAVGGITRSNPGTTITFTATPSGGFAPYAYQWRVNGVDIGGANAATFSLANLSAAMDGDYACVVTDSHSATDVSNLITVVTNTAVEITTQPSDQAVLAGQTATFHIVATGTGPLSYQWQFNGVNIAGTTTDTLTIPNAQAANAGSYRCIVTNVVGSVNSNAATLTINGALQVSITSEPIAVLEGVEFVVHVIPPPPGQNVLFTATASGGIPPYAYQWRKDGVDISGATGNTYTVTNADDPNEGVYTCHVTDSAP